MWVYPMGKFVPLLAGKRQRGKQGEHCYGKNSVFVSSACP